jgi:hypothetical protein
MFFNQCRAFILPITLATCFVLILFIKILIPGSPLNYATGLTPDRESDSKVFGSHTRTPIAEA